MSVGVIHIVFLSEFHQNVILMSVIVGTWLVFVIVYIYDLLENCEIVTANHFNGSNCFHEEF